jgi:hypothetical protein
MSSAGAVFGILLGLLGASCSRAMAVSPAPPFTIAVDCQRDRVLSIGDSWDEGEGNEKNTHEPSVGEGQFAPIGWMIMAAQAAHADSLIPGRGTGRAHDIARSQFILWKQNGKSQTGVKDLAINVGPRIIAYAPTIILWHLSSNDYGRPSDPWWRYYAEAMANAVDTDLPMVRWYIVSNELGLSEQWTASGWDPAVARNAASDALNALGASWVATRDSSRYAYVDLRGTKISDPNTLLEYEIRTNLPEPGATLSTILAPDFHPMKSAGQQVISSIFYHWFSITNL